MSNNKRVADALEACNWSGLSIGNKAIIAQAIAGLRAEQHHQLALVLPAKKYPPGWNKGTLQCCNMEYMDGYNEAIDEIAKLGPLYTHADPGEVEQGYHHAVVDGLVNRNNELREERDALLAQLAKQDALLVKANYVVDHARTIDKQAFSRGTQNVDPGLFRGLGILLAQYDDAISASAGPSKPLLVECDACPTSGGCVSTCMKAPASAGPSKPGCKHLVKCARFNNGEIVDHVCQDCLQVFTPTAREARALQEEKRLGIERLPVERDERAGFEAWAKEQGLSVARTPNALCFHNGTRRSAGDYFDLSSLCSYAAWQARARLERKP